MDASRPDVDSLRAAGDVPGLSEALRGSDDDIADRAARALGDLRDAGAIPALADAVLNGGNAGAVWALTQFHDARLVAPLVAALQHPHATARALSAGKLAELEAAEAVGPLLDVLREDPDAHVREEAARALGLLGDASAVEPLLAALRSDRGDHVREEAAAALGRLGDQRALAPLERALRDRHVMVRRAAERALRRLNRGMADEVRLP